MKDKVLLEYMQRGSDAYDLCIDDGKQVFELTSQQERWARVDSGTTIVMRIIEYQPEIASAWAGYPCPRCDTWNDGSDGSSSIDWYSTLLYYHVIVKVTMV